MHHVVCLKYGDRYSHEYVNHLYSMVKRNLSCEFNFYCMTENKSYIRKEVNILPLANINSITGWWQKLTIFKSDFYSLKGTLLFIDLDMVILNNIDEFFNYKLGDFCVVDNWFPKYPSRVISSCMMRLNIGSQQQIWNNFIKNKKEIMKKYSKTGDQEWIYHQAKSYQLWPSNWILNYKKMNNCRLLPIDFGIPSKLISKFSKTLNLYCDEPKNGKVLAFQGKPDIHEILENPSGKYRAAPWLKKYWC